MRFLPAHLSLLLCAALTVRCYQVTGPTGGVNPATGQRPYRQEFNEFAASGPAFDLYILALQQFQANDQGAQLSYYQVAGQCWRFPSKNTMDELILVQVSMADLTFHGMVLEVIHQEEDIAPIHRSSFRRGIAPTLPYLR